MKPGRGSQTAVMVATWRAVAEGRAHTPRFSDPTAYPLLPPEARERVDEALGDRPARGLRGGFSAAALDKRAPMMVARTVAIDDAVRAVHSPQVVILGAGLDGRAWRMEELRETTVYEVDHPDTQRGKRARVGSLTQQARDVRFVPVDFTKDRLDAALASAGHDATQPTTWVWEGVIMYLTPADVEATLAVVAARSSPASRLVALYHSPSALLHLIGWVVRRVGEPFRSVFTAEAMADLLARHGFDVASDQGLPEIGRALSPEVGQATRFMKHSRIVVADKRA